MASNFRLLLKNLVLLLLFGSIRMRTKFGRDTVLPPGFQTTELLAAVAKVNLLWSCSKTAIILPCALLLAQLSLPLG